MTQETAHPAVSVLTHGKRLTALREHIARLRASEPPASYDDIALELGVNKGVVWMLLHDDEYRPSVKMLHKFGITKHPRRHRIGAQVDEAEHARIKRAAERDGVTMAAMVRDAVKEYLK